MAITIQWKSGDDSIIIDADSYIGFFGDNFGDSIPLDSYQGVTVETNSLGTANYGNLPNTKFTSSTTVDIGNGVGPIYLNMVPPEDCTLHLKILADDDIKLQAVKLIAYSGSMDRGPFPMNVAGFESGSTDWTTMSGSGSPLVLSPHLTPSQTHDYYVGLSASPTMSGSFSTVQLVLYVEWY